METCVLIPQELSLMVSQVSGSATNNTHLHHRNNNYYNNNISSTSFVKSIMAGKQKYPSLHWSTSSTNVNVTVWTNATLTRTTLLHPFQGTIRLDKIDVFNHLDDSDVRNRYGCYDEITEVNRRRVRHCNWIRFLKVATKYSDEVNVLGTKIKGEPIYETIKTIPANSELVVYYLPETPEEMFFMPAMHYLRHTLYRRTMDTILEDSPLDLSMSLLSSRSPITSNSCSSNSSSPASAIDIDERKSCSEESLSSTSLAGDLSVASEAATSPSPLNLNRQRHSSSSSSSAKTKSCRGERTLLPCEVCKKAFDRPSLLKRHMRTHTGEKPHVCAVCNKGFSTSSSLNTHRRIHSGEKPHQCQVCGKRFTASSNLYYHRMTHIKEKPHKCSLCSKSFPTPGDLKSHMYVHNGSWPFKCHICNRGFSKHTNLKNHLFLHTGDKPHSCDLCHKKFALACNLRAHMKTHETECQEECLRCGKMYLVPSPPIGNAPNFCRNCLNSSIYGNSIGSSKEEKSQSSTTLLATYEEEKAQTRYRRRRIYSNSASEEEQDADDDDEEEEEDEESYGTEIEDNEDEPRNE